MFDRFGAERYGEDASQLQHALQCAQLARQHGCSDDLIAASLLHDIGQFLDDAGNAAVRLHIDGCHETTGSVYLSRAFGPEITEPVRLHVDAKRYLCTVRPEYQEGLSGASILSLELQGGTMTGQEVEAFLANPHAEAALQLRRFDDAGKQPDWEVPGLDAYRPMLESLQRSG
ncbi:MAG: phosphohydrolase [Novosphingobium sp.]